MPRVVLGVLQSPEHQIEAYQVMEKYLKDRKGRQLALDEINHYMKVVKTIRLTIGLQRKIDEVYANVNQVILGPFGA